MDRRQQLGRMVGLMVALLVLAFLWVLFRGIFSGSTPGEQVDPSLQARGQTVLRRVDGQRVWVTRLSSAQRESLKAFDAAAVAQSGGCQPAAAICRILTDTGRVGIELRFVKDAPPSLPSGLPWIGGFINPDTGAVYDLLGRAYRYQGAVAPLTLLLDPGPTDN